MRNPLVSLSVGLMLALVGARKAATGPASGPFAATQPAEAEKPLDPRQRCARNMAELIQAGIMWSNAHNMDLPGDFQTLFGFEDFDLRPSVVLCANRQDRAPENWDKMSQPKRIAWAVKHTSYIWEGAGIHPLDAITTGTDADLIVISENPHSHHAGGMNLGFADGHVAYFTAEQQPTVRAKNDAARIKLKAKSGK